jgi:hypothetical protein
MTLVVPHSFFNGIRVRIALEESFLWESSKTGAPPYLDDGAAPDSP